MRHLQLLQSALLRILAMLTLSFFSCTIKAQDNKPVNAYFTIENYYRVKWGYADEFIELWKKNHFPLLKKAMQKGDIISVTPQVPVLHSGEDTRWDFKVVIVFKNVERAIAKDLTTPYKKELYPDTAKLEKDEQHRFELLISHWDIMVENLDVK